MTYKIRFPTLRSPNKCRITLELSCLLERNEGMIGRIRPISQQGNNAVCQSRLLNPKLWLKKGFWIREEVNHRWVPLWCWTRFAVKNKVQSITIMGTGCEGHPLDLSKLGRTTFRDVNEKLKIGLAWSDRWSAMETQCCLNRIRICKITPRISPRVCPAEKEPSKIDSNQMDKTWWDSQPPQIPFRQCRCELRNSLSIRSSNKRWVKIKR